jgi:hypothetical protein
MRSHKPEALRTSLGLCSFFSAKFYEDVLDVRLNRFRSNGEVPCDFLVGKALPASADSRQKTESRHSRHGEGFSADC